MEFYFDVFKIFGHLKLHWFILRYPVECDRQKKWEIWHFLCLSHSLLHFRDSWSVASSWFNIMKLWNHYFTLNVLHHAMNFKFKYLLNLDAMMHLFIFTPVSFLTVTFFFQGIRLHFWTWFLEFHEMHCYIYYKYIYICVCILIVIKVSSSFFLSTCKSDRKQM